MADSLRKETTSGIKWTAFASLITSIGGLFLLAVLARNLDKADFGLMAIVNILTIFSVELVDMGIGQAIIQKQKATALQLSSLFWINISLGVIVFLGLYLVAPFISNFYENPRLTTLIQIISFIFIFNGLSSQYQALFQRDFRFKLIASIDIISFGIYFILVIVLVFMGYGVYSLVWGSLVRAVVRSLSSFAIGSKTNLPSFVFDLNEIKVFLNFGAFRFGAFIITYFSKRLDSLLLGKLLGMDVLGVYDVYQRILQQPIKVFSPIINKVTFPLFSKLNKDKEKGKYAFLQIFNLLNSLRLPIFIFLIVAAEPIVKIFLGESWLENILVFKILALFFLFRTIGAFTGTVMVAGGKANWSFYISLIMVTITPLAIYFGSKYQMLGVAIALLTINILTQIPRYIFIIRKILPISLKEYFTPIIKPFIFSCLAALSVFPFTFIKIGSLPLLILMSMIFGAVYATVSYFFNNTVLIEITKFIPAKFRMNRSINQ